ENRGSSRPSAIDRPPAQASPLRSYIRPELRFPHAAAQTRIVSVARIRLDSRKSVRPFKGIFCDDISEFESHMPSQPVASPWAMSGSQKYARHSRELVASSFDARSWSDFKAAAGSVIPSDFAVLRLTISANFVSCWTGRSAGFSPFRTRPL